MTINRHERDLIIDSINLSIFDKRRDFDYYKTLRFLSHDLSDLSQNNECAKEWLFPDSYYEEICCALIYYEKAIQDCIPTLFTFSFTPQEAQPILNSLCAKGLDI